MEKSKSMEYGLEEFEMNPRAEGGQNISDKDMMITPDFTPENNSKPMVEGMDSLMHYSMVEGDGFHAGGDDNEIENDGGDDNENDVLDIGALKAELEKILGQAARKAAESVLIPQDPLEHRIERNENLENYAQGKFHMAFDNIDLLEDNFRLFPDSNDSCTSRPSIVWCPTLKSLKICTTKILNCSYYKRRAPLGVCFQEPLEMSGKERLLDDKEILLRVRLSFLLRSLRAPKLTSFVMINDDDEDGQGRLAYLEEDVAQFLDAHSSSLEKIIVRSVMPSVTLRPELVDATASDTSVLRNNNLENPAEALQFKPKPTPEGEDEVVLVTAAQEDAMKTEALAFSNKTFPNLKELEIILWQVNGLIERTPPLDSYWVKLVQNEMTAVKLEKLVWSCSQEIFGNQLLLPLLESNKSTLEILHVLCTSDVGIETSRTKIIVCSQFQDMVNLTSMYLKDFSNTTMLLEVNHLPMSLCELSLDGIRFRTCDLEICISRLINLVKLRLVANGLLEEKFKNGKKKATKLEGYGIDERIIKVILEHRKLNDVFLWGLNLGQYGSWDFRENKSKRKDANAGSKFRCLKFIMQRLCDWLFNPRGWKTKVGVSTGALHNIAKVDENSIRIIKEDFETSV